VEGAYYKDEVDEGLERYNEEEARCTVAVSGDDISRWEEEPHFEARGQYGVVQLVPGRQSCSRDLM
jgi:hypothetical protein